ncbi:hypothetical protein [Nocardia sp. NPDC051750]|uniref:hypothetical protein n=1 Tax=Nocardia sp. NPDC051750 TaxID=3364325 RepID=UPI00378FC58F
MTGHTKVHGGYDMVIDRLETLGEPDTAEVVRQLRRVYIAEVDHLQQALALVTPRLAAALTAPASASG